MNRKERIIRSKCDRCGKATSVKTAIMICLFCPLNGVSRWQIRAVFVKPAARSGQRKAIGLCQPQPSNSGEAERRNPKVLPGLTRTHQAQVSARVCGDDHCKGAVCYYNGPSWNPAMIEQEIKQFATEGRPLWLYVTCPDHATRAPWNDPALKYES